MMKSLLIGYGSIGRRHANLIKKSKQIRDIVILTKQKLKNYKTINNFEDAIIFNPDYIFVANNTEDHYRTIKKIEKNFKDKIILVEKPLFEKEKKITIKNNRYFVGYNLRFHPVIKKIYSLIKHKKINYADFLCESYLPSWRKNISYQESSSAQTKGGGVLLDLSHELDLALHFFNEVKVISAINEKVSNLSINSDDIFLMHGTFNHNNKKAIINVKLNYFSNISSRKIVITGDDFKISGDLEKNFVEYTYKNEFKKFNFEKNSLKNTYQSQLESMLNKKYSNLCSLQDGYKVMKLIKRIRASQIT